jgi:L-2-hydroxycarboxylate dehydrogenase (NAD+)
MINYAMPHDLHDAIVTAAFRARGFDEDEARATARLCRQAARHGVRTHNALKALHLDDHFGSRSGGCAPRAAIEKLPTKYKAVQRWNARRKSGPATAYAAMDACMKLADEYGIGAVTVDNAFHYLWGGGYVLHGADRGYIAYTCCTAALAEVVPHQGRYPTLGTNPHSWAFPTRDALGFNVCIDWATSVVAMGRVQQLAREGAPLPPGCAVDEDGAQTTDPARAKALLPFGQHKGYGLSLVNELMGAFTGGSLPTLRSRWGTEPADEKRTPSFFFQCIRPDALDCGDFARGRSQPQNVRAVIGDILGHGNESCLLPGQPEAEFARRSDAAGGLLFTRAEVDAFAAVAREVNVILDPEALPAFEAP